MQVWWGRFRGARIGLMTDSLGIVPRAADVSGLSHLGRVAALVGCFAHDSIATLAGVDLDTALRCLGLLGAAGYVERCDQGWRARKTS